MEVGSGRDEGAGWIYPSQRTYREGSSVHVCIQQCTHVYTRVYSRVHSPPLVESAKGGIRRAPGRVSLERTPPGTIGHSGGLAGNSDPPD